MKKKIMGSVYLADGETFHSYAFDGIIKTVKELEAELGEPLAYKRAEDLWIMNCKLYYVYSKNTGEMMFTVTYNPL